MEYNLSKQESIELKAKLHKTELEIDSLRIQLSQMEVSRNEAAALVQQLQN